MKIHKDCRIELAASKDKTRKAISEPYLALADTGATLVATDGRILAMIPVPVDAEDAAGYVSADVLKAARKGAPRSNEAFVSLNGAAKIPGGIEMPRSGSADDCQFPNWRAVVPAEPASPQTVVCIDARRLWLLAQAMGTEGVRLILTAPDEPIHVQPVASGVYSSDRVVPACDGARGVIMPIIMPADAK